MAKRGRKPKNQVSAKVSGDVIRSTFSLLLILFGVLTIISFVSGYSSDAGALNSKLYTFLNSYFGVSTVFMPFVAIYAGVFFFGLFKNQFLNKRILLGLIVMFISFAGLLGESAGLIGGILRNQLALNISSFGAIFTYFISFTASVFIVINMGIKSIIENISAILSSLFSSAKDVVIPDDDAKTLEITDGTDKGYEIQSDFQKEVSEYVSPAGESEIIEKKSKFEVLRPPSEPVIEGKKHHSEDEVVSNANITEGKKPKLPFSNKLWEYPPISLLNDGVDKPGDAGNIQDRANMIESTLAAFGIKAKIANVNVGPAVTQYALDLAVGTKASRVQNISTDLALRLKSPSGSVRVVAPIPGTNLVGIEVPNFTPSSVSLRTVLISDDFKKSKAKLKVAMGKDVLGRVNVQDISKWPHALVAGSTGSGKSVMLNAIIGSLLFNCSPQELRLIMIDPKFVELSQYNGIPHLLTPVVTDVEQKAVSTFAWAVSEMENRYKTFAQVGARNLDSYNALSGFQAMPYIIIIVDELADMMMVAASEVEKYITRLAQKSRATGIHLILATQRPSVNVLTGTIKANIPTRISFKVTSNTDSRVILDQSGAETLIGRGDMLFIPPDDSKPQRIQGVFVHDKEIRALVDFFKQGNYELDYREDILDHKVGGGKDGSGKDLSEVEDPKFIEALEVVVNEGKASASHLQRRLSLGYTRAARIIDEMEKLGVIGQARGSKPREVLIASVDEYLDKLSKK